MTMDERHDWYRATAQEGDQCCCIYGRPCFGTSAITKGEDIYKKDSWYLCRHCYGALMRKDPCPRHGEVAGDGYCEGCKQDLLLDLGMRQKGN